MIENSCSTGWASDLERYDEPVLKLGSSKCLNCSWDYWLLCICFKLNICNLQCKTQLCLHCVKVSNFFYWIYIMYVLYNIIYNNISIFWFSEAFDAVFIQHKQNWCFSDDIWEYIAILQSHNSKAASVTPQKASANLCIWGM